MSAERNNQRIARNTVFLYGRLLVVLILSLYTVRLVLNALGVEDYGIYNVVGGFVSMFGFLNTSMANATQRFYNYEIGRNGSEAANGVYNAAVRTQAILAMGVVAATEIIGVWYLNTRMTIPEGRLWVANWILQFSIISLLFTIVQVPFSAAALAYERMDFYAIVGVIDVILKLGIAIFIKYYSGDQLLLYGIMLMIIAILNFSLYLQYSKRNFGWLTLKSIYSSKTQKEMLSFSGWSFLGSFAYMVRGHGVNILLNYFFGVVVNAANGIANQVSGAIQQFSTNLTIAFSPQLVESYASGDYNRSRKMFYMMSKTSYCLLYMMAVPLIINMDYILRLWLGTNIPEYTAAFASLTVVIMLIGSLHTPISRIIQATGKVRFFQIATSIVICSIIPLSWIGFNLGCNPNSCYCISIAVYIFNHGVAMVILKKLFDYKVKDYCLSVLLRCGVFTILLPVIPLLIKTHIENEFYILYMTSLITALISIPLFLTIVLNRNERNAISIIIKHRFSK